MPDLVAHIWFSERVAAALPPEVRSKTGHLLYPYAAVGPDVWFPLGFYGTKDKPLAKRGGHMHENETGAFLTALTERCRTSKARDLLFAYLAGYICHYAMDRTCHPYIVYRTGDYLGTPETLRYRGNHTRLERAIDVWIIREKYGSDPRRFNLNRRCLPLRRLPEALREDITAVYDKVYGWPDAFDALNRAIRDHHLLYWLVRDTTGVLNQLTKLTDNGVSGYDYRYFSYQGRDIDGKKLDYLNLSHAPWKNFADPALVSTESFPELADRAEADAVDIIQKIYNYVYLKQGTLTELSARIGNASYTSGLDCRNEKIFGEKTCDPLF